MVAWPSLQEDHEDDTILGKASLSGLRPGLGVGVRLAARANPLKLVVSGC